MAAADYTTVADVKARLGLIDATNDAILTSIVTSASRLVDSVANRRFYQITATRYYTALGGSMLEIDDLVSVTSLLTDISGTRVWDTTWAVTDYDLTPDNAADINWPYTAIRQRPFTSRWFPTIRKAVQVTGVWGWPAVPNDIVEATILQSIRLFKRKDSPFGVAGQGDFGRIALLPRVDPDVAALCAPYTKHTIGAV
jgi:hypothetical protein